MQNIFYAEGNVGSAFELKTIPGKKDGKEHTVLNFTLRCPVQTKQEDNSYEDTGGFWVNVEYWGGLAEMTHKLLKKGIRLAVMGRLSESSSVGTKGDNAGKTFYTKTVRADSVTFSPLGVHSIELSNKIVADEKPIKEAIDE